MSYKGLNSPILGGHGNVIAKGGVAVPFPWRLHEMLEVAAQEGLEDIVSWAPHGRAFRVHHPKHFTKHVLPRFFSQTKYPSFQRQLNIYGFSRFTCGTDKGAYYHLGFVRGHPDLVRNMVRRKIKGTKSRQQADRPEIVPNFYDSAWKDHFDASLPPSLEDLRTLSPLKKWHDMAMKAPSSQSGYAPPFVGRRASIYGITGSDSSKTTEASTLVFFPSVIVENIPIYDDPFEPTPIREEPFSSQFDDHIFL